MNSTKRQYYVRFIVFDGMKYMLLVLLFFFSFSATSQKEKPKNYKRFDERMFHFGFMLGVNKSNFVVFQDVNAYSKYGITSLTSQSTPGGQVGIVSTMKVFTPVVRLRLLPTLSFQERVLNYTYQSHLDPSKDSATQERIGSTNLDFPLMLQFRTLRYNNFAAYLLAGGQYTIDLQSQEKASQNFVDPFIKIKRKDFQAQVGAGVEFFMPYFKFGIELKYSQSFKNSFIQDYTNSSRPIERLYNNVVWLSFIFEG